jgi:hypothetical protein
MGEWNDPETCKRWRDYTGMSLRAYFAGQALVGELAASSTKESVAALIKAAKESGNTAEQHIVIQCVRYADALIAELNKTQQ